MTECVIECVNGGVSAWPNLNWWAGDKSSKSSRSTNKSSKSSRKSDNSSSGRAGDGDGDGDDDGERQQQGTRDKAPPAAAAPVRPYL